MTTTTLSREQYEYAVEQVRRAGLSDRVAVLMEDYRDLRGRYDKLVSIEMIEAVFPGRCPALARGDRIWTLYLAYCEAGFAERRICDVRLVLTKPRYRITSPAYAQRSDHSQQPDLSLSA